MPTGRMRPTVVAIVAIALLTVLAAAVLLAGRDHDENAGAHDGHGAGASVGAGDAPFDRDFIDNMVPHHQGAIEMAQVLIERGTRPEVKTMAEAIIESQQREIEQMRRWRQEWYGSAQTPAAMEHEAAGMDVDTVRGADDVDRAFLEAMVDHHDGAIEMAEQAADAAEHAEVERLAVDIVAAQQREIAQMTAWREQWYPTG